MSLVRARKPDEIIYSNTIASKIQQRRYQLLVHSLIYYELDVSLVEDSCWSKWAQELVSLQNDNSDISSKVIFYESFKDFDGSTGFNLPYRDLQIINIASRLLHNLTGYEEEYEKLKSIEPIGYEYERFKVKGNVN